MEFALILPLLITMLFGLLSVSFYFLSRHNFQNGVDVLAQLAARDPSGSWHQATASENERTRCNADPMQPAVEYPDGNDEPGSRVVLTWYCHLHTGWLFDGLTVPVSSAQVIQGPIVTPSPSPSGSANAVAA